MREKISKYFPRFNDYGYFFFFFFFFFFLFYNFTFFCLDLACVNENSLLVILLARSVSSVCQILPNSPNGLSAMAIFANWSRTYIRVHKVGTLRKSTFLSVDFSVGRSITIFNFGVKADSSKVLVLVLSVLCTALWLLSVVLFCHDLSCSLPYCCRFGG